MTATAHRYRKTVFSGRLSEHEVYTSEHLIEVIGIGQTTLREMRRAGMKGVIVSHKKWFRGADVIRFMQELGK